MLRWTDEKVKELREVELDGWRMRGRCMSNSGKHVVMVTVQERPPTWLCINLRLIPSNVTWRRPPSPVFISWTGNSPPSSGPTHAEIFFTTRIHFNNPKLNIDWTEFLNYNGEIKYIWRRFDDCGTFHLTSPQKHTHIVPGLMLCCRAAARSMLSLTQ